MPASSSSCTSSVGNLGSPKPEKRQANSPLPPTPKNSTTSNSSGVHHHNISNTSSNGTSTASIPSSRNSIASVFESQLAAANNSNNASSRQMFGENQSSNIVDGLTVQSPRNSSLLGSQSRLSVGDSCNLSEDPAKKQNSAKNFEGMYAKVSGTIYMFGLW